MKLGRPREVADPVRVSVRVESREYDRLDKFARESGSTVPAMIRQAISALQNCPQAQTSAY